MCLITYEIQSSLNGILKWDKEFFPWRDKLLHAPQLRFHKAMNAAIYKGVPCLPCPSWKAGLRVETLETPSLQTQSTHGTHFNVCSDFIKLAFPASCRGNVSKQDLYVFAFECPRKPMSNSHELPAHPTERSFVIMLLYSWVLHEYRMFQNVIA